LTFPALREPALIPPSPNYPAPAGGWPQPAEHTPTVRIESQPLATAPALTRHTFRLASFDEGARDYLGDEACAVDMDAAPVAHVCQGRVPFGLVTGVAVPALRDFRDDYEDALRYAWRDVFFEGFGERAAVNVAAVAERICTSF
jgi:nucleoside phosphorylase